MFNYKELLGKRIRLFRKMNTLSQEEFAELINIDPNSVSRIECGVHYPSMDTLERICTTLNIEMRDLFIFSNKETPEEMRHFLMEAISEAGIRNLRKMVCAVREIVKN